MKAINMPTSDGFNFDNHDKLGKIYNVSVYTELSDKMRAVTRVCRGGLGSVNSHPFMQMVEQINE